MEVSGEARSRVAATDFSIERILRCDGPSAAPPPPPAPPSPPPWLFCSRYQPPRIPRISSSEGCRGKSRRSGRHARVPFTGAQSTALETAFGRAPYLAPPALRALAHALHLREDRIKIWFQNRRARERREKCTFNLPPQAVSIPPTLTRSIKPHVETFMRRVHTPGEFMEISETERMAVLSLPVYTVKCSNEDEVDTLVDVETIEDTIPSPKS